MQAERSAKATTITLTEEDLKTFDTGGRLALLDPPVTINKTSKMLPSGGRVPEDYFDPDATVNSAGQLDIGVPMREHDGKLSLPFEVPAERIKGYGGIIIVAAGNT